jgi:hypothetical protein
MAGRSTRSLACMKGYRDPLSYSKLWEVRWLTGTFIAIQVFCGLVGLELFPYQRAVARFWMGGALSMVPGFLVGLLIQYRVAPAKISENKWTVGLVGLISLIVCGAAIAQLFKMGGNHAG